MRAGSGVNDSLTLTEAGRLTSVHTAWSAARACKDWLRADRLRGYLERAGCMGANLDLWHAVFEDPKHRARRLRERAAA